MGKIRCSTLHLFNYLIVELQIEFLMCFRSFKTEQNGMFYFLSRQLRAAVNDNITIINFLFPLVI